MVAEQPPATIVGQIAVTLDDVTMPPEVPSYRYLGVAQLIIPGAKVLAVSGPDSAVSLAIIAAFAIECLLKSAATKGRLDDGNVRGDIRHDLVGLWNAAARNGLSIGPIPQWVAILAPLHKKPYELRYATKANGVSLPNPDPIVSDLESIAEAVRKFLRT